MIWMLLGLSDARATIVNVLTPSVGVLEDGWHGSVKAGITVLDGNEKRIGADLASGLQYKRSTHLVALKASGDVARAFGDKVSQRAFANLRHRWLFADPVSTVEFVQIDHNAFRGLAMRDLAGAGLDFRLFRAEWTEAHLGLTVMGEYQLHSEGFEDDDAGLHARMSDYFTVAVKTETVVLASTTFVQPRLDRWSNWRFLEEVSMTIDISEHLDWNVLFRVERDSSPPTGVEPVDLALKSGLVVGF
ncbi:MAG: DUF481 domain-containing protein [Alphaproteobacteria bacterium]|nr:DUF481 domain-containing protein [Alphaproteobacteria bacterium]